MFKYIFFFIITSYINCFLYAEKKLEKDNFGQYSTSNVRIKDLVEIKGVRINQLTGLGLVIGLAGTGDSKQSLVTNKAVANMITRLGTGVQLNEVTTKNIAAVVINADLPAFAKIGDKIQIRVSSIGDANSLEGGTLILTPLYAADEQVYAIAQGSISMGTAMTGIGNIAKSTAPKTIALANSAIVEKEFEQKFIDNNYLNISLKNADFTTATRITKVINEYFGDFIAIAENSRSIKIKVPNSVHNNKSFTEVDFVSTIEQLMVEPDVKAIVILNERTGTIIAGNNVKIIPVAISHANLEIIVNKKINYIGEIDENITVNDLVNSLNILGVGPKDLVAIFLALQASNALQAELQLM